jgi:dihydrolipoamide dehydrogenase
MRALKRRGIKCFPGAGVLDVADSGTRVDVTFEAGGKEQTVAAEVCLVAIGRGPVTEGLGLQEAGVELDGNFVKVDGSMRTSAQHVWAVGDVASSPLQFAHVAFAEGIGVAERIAGQEVSEIDYYGVPKVTFSTPEMSSVGLTEAQARERGYEVQIESFNFQALGKANIVGEGGLAKMIAEPDGGQILGIHMIGPHVTDLISEAMLITNWEASVTDVSSLIHPHPTLSEAIGEAALALAGKPLHSA